MVRFVERFVRDRRLVSRHCLKTPLLFHVWKSAIPEQSAEMENLSERGILFSTDYPIPVHTSIELSFQMPPEVTGECAADWNCLGHVVRVELRGPPGYKNRVGVQFDFYQVAPVG